MPTQLQSRLCQTATALYARLLNLYPRPFRADYAAPMTQLFRDQCRDAIGRGGAAGLTRLAVRTVPDFIGNLIREHWQNLRFIPPMRHPSHRMVRPVIWKMVVVSLLLAGGFLAVQWSGISTQYFSTARIEVSRTTQPDDARFLATQAEIIHSSTILRATVERLGLTKPGQLLERGQKPLGNNEALALLRKAVDVRLSKGTSLIEIRVRNPDAMAAAGIANGIVDAYKQHLVDKERDPEAPRGAKIHVSMVDAPEPGTVRIIWPNPILLALLTAMVAGVGGFMIGKGFREPKRNRPPGQDPLGGAAVCEPAGVF